jgi:hypothetical protein
MPHQANVVAKDTIENFTALPHFSVPAAISLPKAAGEHHFFILRFSFGTK